MSPIRPPEKETGRAAGICEEKEQNAPSRMHAVKTETPDFEELEHVFGEKSRMFFNGNQTLKNRVLTKNDICPASSTPGWTLPPATTISGARMKAEPISHACGMSFKFAPKDPGGKKVQTVE
jgi:hypothetical protein